MPVTNYCKKCKAEVSVGDTCPRCGGKLPKTGERLSFVAERTLVYDWFSWNAMLRVVVPVVGVVLLVTVLIEGFLEGVAGVQSVFVQGFFWTLMSALGVLLLLTLCLLLLQGREVVRYVLDGKGVHAYTCLKQPHPLQLYARLMTPQAVEALQAEAPEEIGEGLTLIRRADLSWAEIKRARFWPETRTILLYNPSFWQALCILCGEAEYVEAEAYICKKLARNKGALPIEKRRQQAAAK